MGKYKIWRIERDHLNIKVIIENEVGDRQGFLYPLSCGWGERDDDGELKCVIKTLENLKNIEKENIKINAQAINIVEEKQRNEGRMFEVFPTDEVIDPEVSQDTCKIIKHKEVDITGKTINRDKNFNIEAGTI